MLLLLLLDVVEEKKEKEALKSFPFLLPSNKLSEWVGK